MARARDGVTDAEFTAWMSARYDALLRTAYHLTGELHAAEDLVQATLAKVYLSWDRVNRREVIDGYARRILVNENNSIWRRAWKRREVATARVPEHAGPPERYDEGQHVELWEQVQTLPVRQRTVLVLRYYQELDDDEIADALGITAGTVRSQASRALATLRRRSMPSDLRDAGKEER